MQIGSLQALVPALDHPDLLAAPVVTALRTWPLAGSVGVAAIDASVADTVALASAYGVPLSSSANCVVVGGRRDGVERIAACVVLATTRADVNGIVKRLLDVRKATFLSMDRAVEATGMEYGGITPVGVPATWRLLVDAAAVSAGTVVIGSGVRHSKIVLPGALLAELPEAEVVDALAH